MEENNTQELLPDGFFYENETDQRGGISTKRNGDGSAIKRVLLPRCGKEAFIRKPKHAELVRARLTSKHVGDQVLALVAFTTTIDGKPTTIGEIQKLRLFDFALLTLALESV